jgi:hypothetical protein
MNRASRSRMGRRLRAFWQFLAVGILAMLLTGGAARAEDASPPMDAPLLLRPEAVVLPPLPASYQVRRAGFLTISYPSSIYERMQPLIDKVEGWKAKLADDFGQGVLMDPVEVRIARSWDDMAALAPRDIGVPPYASGVTYRSIRLVLLSLTEPASGGEPTDLETVFHHELAHVALEDAVAGRHVPRWFNEGLAIHESDEHPLLRTKALWDATLSRTILPLAELDRSFPERSDQVNVAYAESADVVRFLLRGGDRVRFAGLIERVRRGESFDRGITDAYGTDVRRLEYQWREECAKRYTFAPMLASGSFIWVLVFGVLVVGYRRRRRQAQETLARWEREERALAQPVETVADEAAFSDPSRVPGLPKIEHDGNWHTLH